MADAMEGQVAEQVKAERSSILIAAGRELEKRYQEALYGTEEKVLFEEIVQVGGANYLVGYSERYVRVAVKAEGIHNAEEFCNTVGSVCITGRLAGEVLEGELR